jgi:hypothetical protein
MSTVLGGSQQFDVDWFYITQGPWMGGLSLMIPDVSLLCTVVHLIS